MPLGTILATGWASGLNVYGTALILGVAGRLDWAETPPELQETWVLAVLATLYALEFVVDKVPLLDSAWDAIHTVVRPVGGGLLGVALAHDADSSEALAAVLGGSLSLAGHAAKASARAAINTSPEPFSNVIASLAEDGIVAAMVTLALAAPAVAGVLAVVFGLASVAVAWVLVRAVRRLVRRWRARRRGVPSPPDGPP